MTKVVGTQEPEDERLATRYLLENVLGSGPIKGIPKAGLA